MEEKYLEKLVETEQRSKSNTKRLDDYEKRFDEHDKKLDELSNVYVALTKVDDKVTNVESDVSEIKNDLKEIKDKPSKQMSQIWGWVVGGLIGAVITFLAIKLGLK